MTATRTLVLALFAAGTASLAGHASADETITCPALFPSTSVHFTPTEDGWTAEPGRLAPFLVGWGLSSGPPSDLAQLQESDGGKGWASWKLEGPYPKGVWVECVYGGGGLTLTRRLSATTGVCTERHEKTPPTKPKPVTFVCR